MGKRGIVIPTALFLVLVTFLAATILAARADMDLRVGQYEDRKIALQAVARGASAQALTLLNQDDNWKDHDRDNPVSFGGDPIVSSGWAEQDPNNPLIYHVFGKAEMKGQSENFELSSQVTLRRPDTEGLVFTNAPVRGQNVPSSLFYKRRYDQEWTILPPVPAQHYDENMQLQVDDTKLAGSLVNLGANSNGELFTFYSPGYDADGGLGNTYRRIFHRSFEQGDYLRLYTSIENYTESLGQSLQERVFGGGVLLQYDIENEDWRALPPIPDVAFSNDVAYVEPDEPYTGGIGAIEVTNEHVLAALHKKGSDGLLVLDLNNEAAGWDVIQPPPNRTYDSNGSIQNAPGLLDQVGQAEFDNQGTLVASWTTKGSSDKSIFRKEENQDWELLRPPPRGQFDAGGNWVPIGGLAQDFGHLDVTSDGKIFVLWNPTQHGEDLDYVVFEYGVDENGVEGWTPRPPAPDFSYNSNGIAVQQASTGQAKAAKAMSVDEGGQVVISIEGHDVVDDALTYENSNQFEPLPPLPNSGHSPSGAPTSFSGEQLDPFQAEGGGIINGGDDRYLPVYRY